MTETMLVLGDSFCEHAQYWPQQLALLLGYADGQCHVSGQPGASWWPVRQHLRHYLHSRKEVVDHLSLVILIHPNPARIITTSKDIRANNAIVLPPRFNNTDFEEAQLASSLYYKYINDYEFHLWAERCWFEEVNRSLATVPVVHLFATDASFANAEILTGKKILQPLTELALAVNRSRTHLGNDFKLPNHFTQAHNRVFAQQLAEIIQDRRADFDPAEFKQ